VTLSSDAPALDRRIEKLEDRLFHRYSVPAVTRLLTVSSKRIPIRAHDVGQGEPALFLHPAAFFGAHWMPALAHLHGVRALALDQPGHGLSGGVDYRAVDPRAFTVEWLTGAMDALELERAAIVGNSLGGLCGLWLAAAAPERVSKLVIVGAPATALRGVQADLGLRLLADPRFNRRLPLLPFPRWLARRFLEGAIGERALAALPEEALAIYRLSVRRPAWRLTLPSLMERLLRGREARPEMILTERELRSITTPTLFLWGEKDAYGGVGMAHRAAAQMPEAEVEVWAKAGHLPQLDEPEGFARVVCEYLSGIPASKLPARLRR
jgi:pimeloyl-ACP methyl ester carboxylesterase